MPIVLEAEATGVADRTAARWAGACLAEPVAVVGRGALTVEAAQTFPLERTGEAFDAGRTGRTRGKLVVMP